MTQMHTDEKILYRQRKDKKLRDWFAGRVLPSIMDGKETFFKADAIRAYKMADEMMAARQK